MPKSRKRRVIIAVVLVAILLAIAIFSSMLGRLLRKPVLAPGTATGDDTDIRLIGVIPENGFEVYDAAGKRIGKTPGFAEYPFSASQRYFRRRLVFDTSGAGETLCLLNQVEHRPSWSSPSSSASSTSAGRQTEYMGSNPFLYVHSSTEMQNNSFMGSVMRLLRVPSALKGRTVERIDASIYYWKGPPGKALWTIEGPFEKGQVITRAAGKDGRLEVVGVGTYGEYRGTIVQLTAPGRAEYPSALLAYDSKGKRVMPTRFNYNRIYATRGPDDTAYYLAPRLTPAEISRFTYGEEPLKRTFHNIRVLYDPPAPPRQDYLDEMAGRLPGREVGPGGTIDLSTPQEAMKVVDIANGLHIQRIAWHLTRGRDGPDFASLDDAERDKLTSACERWWGAWDPRIRVNAVMVGLFLDQDLYMPRAFELMRHADPNVRMSAAMVLDDTRIALNGQELQAGFDIITTAGRRGVIRSLIGAVLRSQDPSVGEYLAELAADERPWLWWPALSDERTHMALGLVEDWPEKLYAKLLVASGFDDSYDYTTRTYGQALRLLETIITPEFADISPQDFRHAAEMALARLDEEAAQEVAWQFLRQVHSLAPDGRAVIPFVEYLNRTHGVDIGSAGTDVDTQLYENYDWYQVARDALEWRETGVVPRDVPEGHRAGKADLRVILYDSDSPEKSLVALWTDRGKTDMPLRRYLLQAGDRCLSFTLEVRPGTGGRNDLSVVLQTVRKDKGSSGSSSSFERSGLPLDVPLGHLGLNVVIEKADDPESVLSGTKVFADWWEKYGPAE